MGRIALVIEFVQKILTSGGRAGVAKVNPGGGANITAQHFADSGDDSYPLPGDYAAMIDTPRTGSAASIGYVDLANEPKAKPGEKRIYARDSNTGQTVLEMWLQNDGKLTVLNNNTELTILPSGSIRGGNGNGFFELQDDGVFNVNGTEIKTDGDVVVPFRITATSMVAQGKELTGHNHNAGEPPGTTGPNL